MPGAKYFAANGQRFARGCLGAGEIDAVNQRAPKIANHYRVARAVDTFRAPGHVHSLLQQLARLVEIAFSFQRESQIVADLGPKIGSVMLVDRQRLSQHRDSLIVFRFPAVAFAERISDQGMVFAQSPCSNIGQADQNRQLYPNIALCRDTARRAARDLFGSRDFSRPSLL